MKIIALTKNKSFIDFLENQRKMLFSDYEFELSIESNSKSAESKTDDDPIIFLVDLDLKDETIKVREFLRKKEKIKWIGLSESLSSKDFRKIQMEDFAPDALIKIPVALDDFLDTLSDFKNALNLDDKDNFESDSDAGMGLNFVGLKDSEELDNDQTGNFDELNLNQEVKMTLDEHQIDDSSPALDSNTNARIQNKFDLAFSDSDKLDLNSDNSDSLLSLSDNEEDNSLSLSSPAIQSPAISLNLNDSTSPGMKLSDDEFKEDTKDKIKLDDDIGKLDITAKGIKFKKSKASENISKEVVEDLHEDEKFNFSDHKIDNLLTKEDENSSDINLNFTGVPEEVSFDAKDLSLNEDIPDFNFDSTLDDKSENFEHTVVSTAFQNELKAQEEAPPAIDFNELQPTTIEEQLTRATIVDVSQSNKNIDFDSDDLSEVGQSASFNEFRANIIEDDKPSKSENFTINTDLLEDKADLGFNLDDEVVLNNEPSLGKTKKTVSMNTQPSNQSNQLDEQVRDRNLYMDDLGRLKANIHDLRQERETFLSKMAVALRENEILKSESLNLKAEVEELKAELKLIKNRHTAKVDELRKEIDLFHDKKILLEEKNKALKNELSKLEQKFKIDLNQVRHREKELEGQLDLIKMDTESQVYSRDSKILDLKKKIDALEFNMENMAIKEQKVLEDKIKLEERLNKIMTTLRGSIKVLEEDVDVEQDL